MTISYVLTQQLTSKFSQKNEPLGNQAAHNVNL